MKEFVDKLIGRLEEEKQRLRNLKNNCVALSDHEVIAIEEGAYNFCKNIVNELAEEHINTSTDTSSVQLTNGGCVDCDECSHRTEYCLCDISENEDECPLMNNGWIPCSERLPEENQIVMCSIKKECASYRIVLQRFEDEEYWHNGIIEAWQPLPQPYQ